MKLTDLPPWEDPHASWEAMVGHVVRLGQEGFPPELFVVVEWNRNQGFWIRSLSHPYRDGLRCVSERAMHRRYHFAEHCAFCMLDNHREHGDAHKDELNQKEAKKLR